MVRDLRVPSIEDLVNREPFTTYAQYLEQNGLDAGTPLGLNIMTELTRRARHVAEGAQRGDILTGGGPRQIIALGLTDSEHFAEASEYARAGRFPVAETDVGCASAWTCGHALEYYRPAKALADRMQEVVGHLRQFRRDQVRAVAGDMHLGMLAVAIIVTQWPDTLPPLRCITGFATVGRLERSNVLSNIPEVQPISEEVLLQGATEVIDRLCTAAGRRVGALLVGRERQGSCGQLLTRAEADQTWGAREVAADAPVRNCPAQRQAAAD